MNKDSNTEKERIIEASCELFLKIEDLGTSKCFANRRSIEFALCEQKKQIREQLGFIIQRRIDDLEIRVGLGIAIFNLKMVLKEFDEMRL